jgi:hypothetical protein
VVKIGHGQGSPCVDLVEVGLASLVPVAMRVEARERLVAWALDLVEVGVVGRVRTRHARCGPAASSRRSGDVGVAKVWGIDRG